MRLCAWCGKNKVKKPHWSCEECIQSRSGNSSLHIDVPLKGSDRWFKDRWFRKDQKTWETDIKSRRAVTPDGSVVHRFNDRGDRIG